MNRRDLLWLLALMVLAGAALLVASWINEEQDREDLRYAAEKGGYELVMEVLEKGVNTNIRLHESGCTPLYQAIARGEREMARALLEHGADPAIACLDPDDPKAELNGRTPLHAAAVYLPELIPALLAAGAPADAADNKGVTPLHEAVRHAPEAIADLLAHGASANAQDANSVTPLMLAGHLDAEQYAPLVEDGADVNATDKHGLNALLVAITHGNVPVARYLLSQGATLPDPPPNPGDEPLTRAALSGNVEMVKLVVELGYDVEGAYAGALRSYDLEVVRYLLENGMEPNGTTDFGRTALHWTDSPEMAAVLLEHGADPNAVDHFGMTPLSLNTAYSLERTKLLLEHGGDVNHADLKGRTVLHGVVVQRQLDEVLGALRLLLDHEVNVNASDAQGKTALHHVAEAPSWYGRSARRGPAFQPGLPFEGGAAEAAMRLLLKHGAKVYLPDEDGNTPLHLAVKVGSVNRVRVLLKHGADPQFVNYAGATPAAMLPYEFDGEPRGIEILKLLGAERGMELDGSDARTGQEAKAP